MNQRVRVYGAGVATVLLFLLIQLGALALVEPFQTAGYQTVEDPSDPTNAFVYIGILLVFTAVMLLIIKFDVEWIIRAMIIFTSGLISLYVFSVVVPAAVTLPVDGVQVHVLAWVAAAGVALALVIHPEWYVIDTAGVVMGAGAAGLFGISLGLLPAIALLAALAVYDAISVYGTKHMLTLAEGVMDLRVPILLVIPLTLSYSFLETDEDDSLPHQNDNEAEETGEEDPMNRDAFFIGLGDAVMPTIMVASAAFFSTATRFDIAGIAVNLPSLTAMLGTLLGLVVLLAMVMKGRAHAGLPLLNGGAIGGYLVGALASGVPLLEALGLATYL